MVSIEWHRRIDAPIARTAEIEFLYGRPYEEYIASQASLHVRASAPSSLARNGS